MEEPANKPEEAVPPSNKGSLSNSTFSPHSPIKNVFFSGSVGQVDSPFSLRKSKPVTLGSFKMKALGSKEPSIVQVILWDLFGSLSSKFFDKEHWNSPMSSIL